MKSNGENSAVANSPLRVLSVLRVAHNRVLDSVSKGKCTGWPWKSRDPLTNSKQRANSRVSGARNTRRTTLSEASRRESHQAWRGAGPTTPAASFKGAPERNQCCRLWENRNPGSAGSNETSQCRPVTP